MSMYECKIIKFFIYVNNIKIGTCRTYIFLDLSENTTLPYSPLANKDLNDILVNKRDYQLCINRTINYINHLSHFISYTL